MNVLGPNLFIRIQADSPSCIARVPSVFIASTSIVLSSADPEMFITMSGLKPLVTILIEKVVANTPSAALVTAPTKSLVIKTVSAE